MVDPLSVGALAGVALTEGIKFLYNQADAILTRRAERRRAKAAGEQPPAEALPVQTPPVVAGELAPLEVDDAAADELADELKELRHRLEDYARGYETPAEGDREVLQATLALRDAIEDIVGQRITFAGEQREPSGTPIVTGRIRATEIRARTTAVDVGEMESGQAVGEVDAGVIGEGADVTGVRVTNLGRRPRGG